MRGEIFLHHFEKERQVVHVIKGGPGNMLNINRPQSNQGSLQWARLLPPNKAISAENMFLRCFQPSMIASV